MPNVKLKSEYKDLNKYKSIFDEIIYYKKDTKLLHNPYGAAISNQFGQKLYYIDGKRHRLDGPAIIYSNCDVEYCINNKFLSKEQFEVHPERLKFLGKEHLVCLA